MYQIIKKQELAPNVTQLTIHAPTVVKNAHPGQFVVVMTQAEGERIPLTLAATDTSQGTITLVIQAIGYSTRALCQLNAGDSLLSVLGPLGHSTPIQKYGIVVCVGGGVGVAEVLPICRAMREAGNKVIGIIGARSRDLIILDQEMKAACDQLIIMTDDGTFGSKGLVSDAITQLLHEKTPIDLVYAIGPVPMMATVSRLTQPHDIKTIVCLNPIMLDGTGMCGSCRVTVAGETKFGCVDGPEFDGHQVDFDELSQRLSFFKKQESCLNKNCPRK